MNERNSSGNSSSKIASTKASPFPLPKDCKACPEYSSMLEGFRRFSRKTETSGTGTNANSTESLSSSSESDPEVSVERACPPDTSEIGRAAWTFLHTTAAYYPEQPTQQQQSLMKSFVGALAEFYPCSICAEHLQELLMAHKTFPIFHFYGMNEIVKDNPPKVGSALELSMWFCKIHNEVNESLGKPLFDCSKVFERWRDGPEDGSCD